jgi:putative zinc finger protein
MPTCKQMTEMATDRAEGSLGVLDRLAFDWHLAHCPGCTAYVRQLEATRQAVALIPGPAISPALNDALLASFDAWAAARPALPEPAARPARRFSPWPLLAGAATLAMLVAFARHQSRAPDDWLVGSVLALAALAMAAVAGRLAVGIVVAAVSAAVAAALLRGGGGELDAVAGLDCLATELAGAAVVGGAAWLGARRESRRVGLRALAAGGVAGTIVADAALQITCGAREAMPHLLAFHVGGVLLVAAVALILLKALPGRERA